jgi:hypothetical protein
LNAKFGREDIFESVTEGENDNGVRVLDNAVSKHLIINSTVFPLQNICKYTWLSPDGKSAGDK